MVRRNKLDCPYRNHALSEKQTCSTSFGCSKGFDPDSDQTILADIRCWVDEEDTGSKIKGDKRK